MEKSPTVPMSVGQTLEHQNTSQPNPGPRSPVSPCKKEFGSVACSRVLGRLRPHTRVHATFPMRRMTFNLLVQVQSDYECPLELLFLYQTTELGTTEVGATGYSRSVEPNVLFCWELGFDGVNFGTVFP